MAENEMNREELEHKALNELEKQTAEPEKYVERPKYQRVLAWVLRTGNVTLTMFCFRLLAWLGKAAPGLFTKIKHRK